MVSLLPSLSALSILILVAAYFYSTMRATQELNRLNAVLAGLLRAESSVAVNPAAKIAVGFGGCLDVMANALQVMNQLGIVPPEKAENFNELENREQLEKTFSYFFMHGASAGRVTSNDSLFSELMTAMTSLQDTRLTVGGNAPVMTKRFRVEGVQVMLGARLSEALSHQIDPDVTVVGEVVAKDDIHLILEYQRDAKWGPYSATRANRFIVYNGGHTPFTPLLRDFRVQLTQYMPSLLVVGGLRLLSSEHQPQGTTPAMYELSTLLSTLARTIRIHVEMSSFPDHDQLYDVITHALLYADSAGMNEQELPNIRAVLNRTSGISVVSDSHPRIAQTLDHMRAIFKLLGTREEELRPEGERSLSRLHVHTLAYQVIMTRRRLRDDDTTLEWKNTAAAVAKASLTANRHTCGRHAVDVSNARLLVDDSFSLTTGEYSSGDEHDGETDRENNDMKSQRISFDDTEPVTCWNERLVRVCIAPVLVCKTVVQTVGGGDNVSAAGLVLQI